MLIVESQSLDVYRNLAGEEYLMDRVLDRGPILFLWRSACAVVMGKNQNPWRECRLDLMRQENVPAARRISGGGTVYHDAGNLNYCVIVDRERYREEQAFELVVQALAPFGIRTSRTGVSNLSVDGLKFSGNAFAFRKGRAMHHGTLLLKTDLQRLGRYLGSMVDGIETRAVASVPANVVNLGLELDEVCGGLKHCFADHYEGGAVEFADLSAFCGAELDAAGRRQGSVEWQLHATPKFSVEVAGCRVEVVRGKVTAARGAGAEQLVGRFFDEVVLGAEQG